MSLRQPNGRQLTVAIVAATATGGRRDGNATDCWQVLLAPPFGEHVNYATVPRPVGRHAAAGRLLPGLVATLASTAACGAVSSVSAGAATTAASCSEAACHVAADAVAAARLGDPMNVRMISRSSRRASVPPALAACDRPTASQSSVP